MRIRKLTRSPSHPPLVLTGRDVTPCGHSITASAHGKISVAVVSLPCPQQPALVGQPRPSEGPPPLPSTPPAPPSVGHLGPHRGHSWTSASSAPSTRRAWPCLRPINLLLAVHKCCLYTAKGIMPSKAVLGHQRNILQGVDLVAPNSASASQVTLIGWGSCACTPCMSRHGQSAATCFPAGDFDF